MTYAILWISHVGFGLLLVAAVTAIASRCKRVLDRRFTPISFAIFVLISFAPLIDTGYEIISRNYREKWVFYYGFSEIIVYTIGVIIILIRGLKGSSSGEQRAKSWPRAWLAALAGASVFVFVTTLNIADMRFIDHLANIKHAVTATIQDMLPTQLPKSLNAHFVYEDAVQAFLPDKELPDWFRESRNPDFDVNSAEVQEFLSEHDDVLEIMRKAESIPGYSPPVYTPFYALSPVLGYHLYSRIAEFISIHARSLDKKGDISGARNELGIIERMADHLRSFPDSSAMMVAVRLESIRYRALEYILAQKLAPHENLVDLPINAHNSVREDLLACFRMDVLESLQSAAEGCSHLNAFVNWTFKSMVSASTSIRQTVEGTYFRVFLGPGEIRTYPDIFAYWMDKEADSYEALKSIFKAYNNAQESGEFRSMIHPVLFLLPWKPIDISRSMKCDVHRGLCDLAMAVTAYKARNNSYPTKLEGLVPEYIDRIPLDPFDGKALKMKAVDGGLDLYSVGSEKEDEYNDKIEPIHFYLGKDAYEKFRVTPALEEKRKQAQKRVRVKEIRNEIKRLS